MTEFKKEFKKKAKEEKVEKLLLNTSDILFATLVVTPLAVAFYRGTWTLMNIYVEYFPAVQTLFIGCLIHILFAFTQNFFNDLIKMEEPTACSKIKSRFVRRAYTITFALACIMHWRGGWIILDYLCDNDPYYIIGAGVVSLVGLLLLKSLRNCIAAPLAVLMDSEDVVFSFPLRYGTKVCEVSYILK